MFLLVQIKSLTSFENILRKRQLDNPLAAREAFAEIYTHK